MNACVNFKVCTDREGRAEALEVIWTDRLAITIDLLDDGGIEGVLGDLLEKTSSKSCVD